ncbi:hypothetical protein AB0I93_26650 [Streptomyces sp. NPDC049967]|uniref:hypothetical protein n=1 Tax=Streptomyces sp. NPDC049967 TaxID=3155658 RepID=UPI003421BF55
MATDDFGQNIIIPTLADAPSIATVGTSVGALVPRSVMRFTSASNRNATITSPIAGMIAWLTTEKLMTMYDGTSWTVMAAGASAWKTIALAPGFSHDGNNNGACQYRVLNFFGELSVQLRGGLGITYPAPAGTIANAGTLTSVALPAAARPSTLRTCPGACSAIASSVTSLKVDAVSTGHLLVVGTNSTTDRPPWLSLNGIMYSL